LILAKGGQQVSERLLRDGAGTDGFAERDKDWMTRAAFIASVQLAAPLVKQSQGLCRRAYLISQIVRDPAVGINGVEVGAQHFGQKPCGYMKVFIMRLGQIAAPGAGFFERWRHCRNAIGGGQGIPATRKQFFTVACSCLR
jgi:hypothetical protein